MASFDFASLRSGRTGECSQTVRPERSGAPAKRSRRTPLASRRRAPTPRPSHRRHRPRHAPTVSVKSRKYMDIFLLMGQSNMAGRGLLEDVEPIRDERIRVFQDGRTGWLRPPPCASSLNPRFGRRCCGSRRSLWRRVAGGYGGWVTVAPSGWWVSGSAPTRSYSERMGLTASHRQRIVSERLVHGAVAAPQQNPSKKTR